MKKYGFLFGAEAEFAHDLPSEGQFAFKMDIQGGKDAWSAVADPPCYKLKLAFAGTNGIDFMQ